MHFWINKPAGRSYGSGGRRYPCSSSAPKSRSDHCGRRGREIGPMVTPVHRFQNLNGPSATVHSGTPGPSATTRAQHQQQQQQQQQHHQRHQEHQPQEQQRQHPDQPEEEEDQHQQQQQQEQDHHQEFQSEAPRYVAIPNVYPYETRSHRPSNDQVYVIRGLRPSIVDSNNVTNSGTTTGTATNDATSGNNNNNSSGNNETQLIGNETTNNGFNSRGSFFEGHFSEISDTELAGYRLRCGVWITFVLATGFVSVAKFYFGNRDAGLDMLIFCGLLFTLLLSGCFYSTLFRRAQNTHRHHRNRMDQDDEIATLAAALTIRDNNTRGFQVIGPNQPSHHLQIQQQQQPPPEPPPPPPPPYHIAIQIPPANSPDEAPPPSYDKAMDEDSSNNHTRVFIFSKDEDN